MFFLRLIADGQPFRIGRDAVVIVATASEAGVDGCGFAAVQGNRRMCPLLLNRNAVPSRVQLGASKRSGRDIERHRRSVEEMVTDSRVL